MTIILTLLTLLLALPQPSKAIDYSGALFPFKQNDRWGYISRAGKIIVPPKFNSAGFFSEGFAHVSVGKRSGFINSSAVLFIKPVFDDAYKFSEGMAAVKSNGKWGFINEHGALAIKPQYESAGDFHEELVNILVDGQ